MRISAVVLTSAFMSLNLVMKACLMMSTATSEVTTIMTSGNNTHRWSMERQREREGERGGAHEALRLINTTVLNLSLCWVGSFKVF